jgi:hypothetical protein
MMRPVRAAVSATRQAIALAYLREIGTGNLAGRQSRVRYVAGAGR